MIIKIIELLVLVTLAAISDLKTHKIKNKLILVFMILGLVTNLFLYGGKACSIIIRDCSTYSFIVFPICF